MSPSDPLREALRGVLVAAVSLGHGAAGGVDSLQCRVFATLYALLGDHPVDQRGRCRSCWGPGVVLGLRRRHCRVYGEASVWLQQPEWFLRYRLISELGLTNLSPAQGRVTPTAAGGVADGTGVVPWFEPGPPSERFQTPAVSPLLPPHRFHGAGRPDSTHGGIGERPPNAPDPAVFHSTIRPPTAANLRGAPC
ncbi:MAG: hypothetical protein ACRDS0_18875 [Pseudonocardiaceae bacterium]